VVAGKFGIASMFSVDGQDNNKLHTVGMKDFHITCCRISPNGEEIIFGGPKRHYYVYDLMSGKSNTQRLPPALTNLKKFELSPCGKWMAVAGRFGEVHLFNAFSKELIHSLKQDSQCTALSFSRDSKHLFSHSDTGEVAIFDIRAAKICHRWTDEGCINGSSIAVSENDQFIATGSAQGVVNVYDRTKVFEKKIPSPEKAIMNLTTEITNTVFHPSNEMLAISSGQVFDAIRMIQLPKLQAFQNFPLQAKNQMGYPRVVRFSPGGGYMAIAGTKALLYRLKSFNSY
jgi:U3 small nucleolar RNA-associated protein 18